ncbi:unnamed protein product [Ectocarpus sp. 8 AP-2014]
MDIFAEPLRRCDSSSAAHHARRRGYVVVAFCVLPLLCASRIGIIMADVKIDRTKVCPLLLRCFWTQNRHRRGEDYSNINSLPRDELQIYTWPDATVREITTLIQGVVPAARRRQGRLSYAFVYPDSQGKQVLRQVASVFSVTQGQDDNKTLRDLKFQTGDYMEVAIG